jgi:hypothetical protein
MDTLNDTLKVTDLSRAQQELAYAKWLENATDYDWYAFIFEDAKAIGALLGIEDMKISFNGFDAQGDGACFTGTYAYAKGSVQAVKAYAATDTELHRIAQDLAATQKRYFYNLRANLTGPHGNYVHENSIACDVFLSDDYYYPVSADAEDGITEPLKALMRWIYRVLEVEYRALRTFSAFLESAEANRYEYDAEGNQH